MLFPSPGNARNLAGKENVIGKLNPIVNIMNGADLNKTGATLFQQQKYAEAILYFSRAIQAEPINHVYLVNRSAAYALASQFQEALADAENAIQIQPNYPRGYLRKGNALIHLNRYLEALQTIEAGLKLQPDNQELILAQQRASTHVYIESKRNNKSNTTPTNPIPTSQPDNSIPPPFLPFMSTTPSFSENKTASPSLYQTISPYQSNSSGSISSSSTNTPFTSQHSQSSENSLISPPPVYSSSSISYKMNFIDINQNQMPVSQIAPGLTPIPSFSQQNNPSPLQSVSSMPSMPIPQQGTIANQPNPSVNLYPAPEFSTGTSPNSSAYSSENKDEEQKEQQPATQEITVSKKFSLSSIFGNSGASANKKGVDLLLKGKPQEAIVELNKAVALAPHNHQFLCNRAAAYIELGNLEASIADLNNAIKIEPNYIRSYVRKAQVYLILNQIVDARAILNEASKFNSSKKEKELIQKCYLELERKETYLTMVQPSSEPPPPYPGSFPLFSLPSNHLFSHFSVAKYKPCQ